MKPTIVFALFLACCGVLLGDTPDSRSPSLLQDRSRRFSRTPSEC
jgi:hypothetical protein